MSRTFGFIGLGLIGGSLAKALRETEPDCRILAFSESPLPSADLCHAREANVADELVFCLSAFSSCDFIFLCAPVDVNISYLPLLKEILSPHTILTDVGSVKSNIHHAVRQNGLAQWFVGGHPMTGSERSGFKNSNPLFLENAYYAVTSEEDCNEEAVASLVSLIRQVKALPVLLSPEEHDSAVAAISHVPHLIAAQLVNLVRTADNCETMRLLAAGGFKDITRIASSSPALWESILSANTPAVLSSLDTYIALLEDAKKALSSSNKAALCNLFSTAGEFRSSLQDCKGVLPESFVLHADLRDEAGAIATFASILAAHGINMKNIGIVHNRAYEQGALRIEFYDKSSLDKAYELLNNHNFSVYR